MNAGDLPRACPCPGADHTLDLASAALLREMIEKTTLFAVSQDDKKPAHTGELFVIEPGKPDDCGAGRLPAGHYRSATSSVPAKDIRIIIPAKTLQELLKIMGGADDDVKIDANRRYVVFTSNGYTIMSRLIEGRLPQL